MSIHLTIEANDAEVEAALEFLKNEFPNLHTNEQIFALERTILWIRAGEPYAFKVDPKLPYEVQLAFGDDAQVSLPPSHMPAQSPVSS